MLKDLSATFRDMSRFINQSLIFYVQAQADYTCWRGSARNFW